MPLGGVFCLFTELSNIVDSSLDLRVCEISLRGILLSVPSFTCADCWEGMIEIPVIIFWGQRILKR